MRQWTMAAVLWLAWAILPGCGPGEELVGPARAAGTSGQSAQAVPPGLAREVPNFAKVSDVLYRGGQPTAKGYAELKKLGIRTVVCLRIFDLHSRRSAEVGLRQVHISFKPVHPEDEDVLAFLKVVTDPACQPVFVHCREGVDRTGMMVAAYRMVVQGWPRELAIAELRRMGFREVNRPILRYLRRMDVSALRAKLAEAGGSPPR